jgi:hypothetical protein
LHACHRTRTSTGRDYTVRDFARKSSTKIRGARKKRCSCSVQELAESSEGLAWPFASRGSLDNSL